MISLIFSNTLFSISLISVLFYDFLSCKGVGYKKSLAWPHSLSITAPVPRPFTAPSVLSAPVPSLCSLLNPLQSGASPQDSIRTARLRVHVARSSDAVISVPLLRDPSVAFGTLDATPAHFPQGWRAGVAGCFLPALWPAFPVLLLGPSHLPDLHSLPCPSLRL